MPTPQADILYPKAVAILEELKKMVEDVNSTKEVISGELLIGASTIPGAYILPRMAADFKEKHPGVSFEIRIADSLTTINLVKDHKLLLGVVGAKTATKNVNFQPFIGDELILVASSARELATKIKSDELLKLPFLLREDGSGTRKNIESFLTKMDIRSNQLNISAILGNNTAIKEAIKADLGVSIISKYAVQEELDAGVFQEIAVDGLSLKRKFYIVTAQRRTLPNHYKVFLNTLLQEAE